MLDGLKEDLLNIRKNLEKGLIKNFVAGHSYTTSVTQKQTVEQIEKTTIDGLKTTSSNYINSFTTSAKGQWVTQAKQTFKQTTEKFDCF